VTYADKITAADRTLDPATRPADELERAVRALTPHIGARIALATASCSVSAPPPWGTGSCPRARSPARTVGCAWAPPTACSSCSRSSRRAGARWPPPTSCEVARCEARRGLQARQGPLSEDAITKLDLAEYYAAVAPAMVPLIHGRPLNLQRYPDGLGGKALFTQQAPKHFPDWIARATVPKKDGTVDHAVVERADTLVYLAGQACLTCTRGRAAPTGSTAPTGSSSTSTRRSTTSPRSAAPRSRPATSTASAGSSRSRWSPGRGASTSSRR
jgi:hypothetical protein